MPTAPEGESDGGGPGSPPTAPEVEAAPDAGDDAIPDGDLVMAELAEYERWAGASLRVGEAGSRQRAAFVADSVGQGVLTGGATGLGMGLAGGLAGRAATYGASRLLSSAFSAKLGGKFVPVPGVGAMIGGAIALSGMLSKDWSASGRAIAGIGTGTTQYERLANTFTAMAEVFDVLGNVASVLGGVLGAAAAIAWAITVATGGIASPLAGLLTTLAVWVGLSGDILSAVGTLVFQPLALMFRTLHTFTSDGDPGHIEQQGAQLTSAAAATAGQLGGLAGGALAKRVPAPQKFKVELAQPTTPHPDPQSAAVPPAGSQGAPPAATGKRKVGAESVHAAGSHGNAVSEFEVNVRQDPKREAAVWHNTQTGESVVVQGRPGSVDMPSTGKREDWHLTDHYHPGRGARRTAAPIDVIPSGADMSNVHGEAWVAGKAKGSRVHYPIEPGPGGKWGSTDFGVDTDPKPFWATGPFGLHGERQTVRFKTRKAYERWAEGYGVRDKIPGRITASGQVARNLSERNPGPGPGSGGFGEGWTAARERSEALRTQDTIDALGFDTSARLPFNPNYNPPPGTPEQLAAYLAERNRLQAERQRARAVEQHLDQQQQHHEANQGPIGQAVTNTESGAEAAKAHTGAVEKTRETNTEQQGRATEAGSTLGSYASRAAGLATLKATIGAFNLAADGIAYFGNYPGRATIDKISADGKRLSKELSGVDLAVSQQVSEHPAREAALRADAARIAAARQQAETTNADMTKAQQGASELQDENARRIAEAGTGKATAAQEGAQLDAAAEESQAGHDQLAGQLAAWAQAQRDARRQAFEAAHASIK